MNKLPYGSQVGDFPIISEENSDLIIDKGMIASRYPERFSKNQNEGEGYLLIEDTLYVGQNMKHSYDLSLINVGSNQITGSTNYNHDARLILRTEYIYSASETSPHKYAYFIDVIKNASDKLKYLPPIFIVTKEGDMATNGYTTLRVYLFTNWGYTRYATKANLLYPISLKENILTDIEKIGPISNIRNLSNTNIISAATSLVEGTIQELINGFSDMYSDIIPSKANTYYVGTKENPYLGAYFSGFVKLPVQNKQGIITQVSNSGNANGLLFFCTSQDCYGLVIYSGGSYYNAIGENITSTILS